MPGIKISASYAELDKIIRIAHGFTAKETSAPAYQRCILFEADDDTLTVTAQSTHNAVKIIKGPEVKIETPGRFMVQAHHISTAFGVMQPDQDVTIEWNSETRHISLSNNDQNIDLPLPPIGDNVNVPQVGEPDKANGIKFDPEKFRAAYSAVASARDTTGTVPVISGVLAEPDLDNDLLRFIATDGKICTATEAVQIDTIGDGCKGFIFDSNSLALAMGYFGEGERVEMHSDSKGQLHFLVLGKGDAIIYHIRSGVLDIPVEKFPAMKLRNSITAMVEASQAEIVADKAEFQRVLRACSALGGLDPAAAGGQARKIGIKIDDNGLSPYLLTGAQYDETIPVGVESTIAGTIEFVLSYGLYGHLIDVYNNEKDNSKIKFAVVYGGTKVKSLALYRESLLQENGSPAEYICIIGVSAPAA